MSMKHSIHFGLIFAGYGIVLLSWKEKELLMLVFGKIEVMVESFFRQCSRDD